MAEEGTYEYKIRKIKNSLTNNKENLALIISNYKNNVSSINSSINNYTIDNWSDAVKEEYSSYIEYLRLGIVSKLNSSTEVKGSLSTLEQLLKDLEIKCDEYLSKIDNIPNDYQGVCYNSKTNSFTDEPLTNESKNEESTKVCNITELNTQFSNLTTDIDAILEKIKKIKFDTVIEYEPSNNYDFSNIEKKIPKSNKKDTPTDTKKEDRKEEQFPTIPGHMFISDPNSWICIHASYDPTKTIKTAEDRWFFNNIEVPSGDSYWLYNLASGEFQLINRNTDMDQGFWGDLKAARTNNGEVVHPISYEATPNNPIEHVIKNYPESLQDKWQMTIITPNEEEKEAAKEEAKKRGISITEDFDLNPKLATYKLYNIITGESKEIKKAIPYQEEDDKYIIEYDGRTYIAYKDNTKKISVSQNNEYEKKKKDAERVQPGGTEINPAPKYMVFNQE